jgi:CRP-like cAMP-binding protein
VAVALFGIVGWLSLKPFFLLSFIFAQPPIAVGIILFLFAAVFFQSAMILEHFDAGEISYRQGSPSRFVYLLKSGTVEATQTFADGKEPVVGQLRVGVLFGYAGLMSSTRNIVTARAVTESGVVRIRPTDFLKMFAEIPELKSQRTELQGKIKAAYEKFGSPLPKP